MVVDDRERRGKTRPLEYMFIDYSVWNYSRTRYLKLTCSFSDTTTSA